MTLITSIARKSREFVDSVKQAIASDVPARPAEPGSDTVSFFRYVRPLDPNNPNENWDLEGDEPYYFVGPHGGITLYFHLHPAAKTAEFSFAICHAGEAFVRKQGRDEAQASFVRGDVAVLRDFDQRISLAENLFFALGKRLQKDTSEHLETYRLKEPPGTLEISPGCKFGVNKWVTLFHTMKMCYAQRNAWIPS